MKRDMALHLAVVFVLLVLPCWSFLHSTKIGGIPIFNNPPYPPRTAGLPIFEIQSSLPVCANDAPESTDYSLSDATPARTGGVSTDFVICGGGPAGLLSAIMLAQKFPKVGPFKLLNPTLQSKPHNST